MQGLMELRKHVDSIIYLIETMLTSKLPCFMNNFNMNKFKDRFWTNKTDSEVFNFF